MYLSLRIASITLLMVLKACGWLPWAEHRRGCTKCEERQHRKSYSFSTWISFVAAIYIGRD